MSDRRVIFGQSTALGLGVTRFVVGLVFLVAAEVHGQRMRAHEALYAANCASCHGTDGGGGQGSSLVDDVWNLGADDASIARVITVGAGDGAMPTFGEVMSEE